MPPSRARSPTTARRCSPTASGRSSSAPRCSPGSRSLLWLPAYFGELTLPTAYPALYWHIHEMIYGYGAAAVAGFTLTAIPNWTGRLPLQGGKLIALVGAVARRPAGDGVLGADRRRFRRRRSISPFSRC